MREPESEEAVAAEIGAAAASKQPIEIQGGGSRRGLGGPVQAAQTMSTRRLTGVTLYEPGALTIVVKAGEPLSAVEALLAGDGQRLAFEPMDMRALLGVEGAEPTIGGVVASAASGPRRLRSGGCRDTLIGARFVNGKGEAIKAGGRVMKNVTGYDVARLMCGAFGTLGVLTETAFKVEPTPEAAATVLLQGATDAEAIRAMGDALGSPYDVSGAAHLPAAQTLDGEKAVTMLRIEGFGDSVAYRAEALRARLAGFAPTEIIEDADQVAAGWRRVRDCLPFANRPGAVWRIFVKPSDAPALAAEIGAARDAGWFFDLGGGLLWLCTPESENAGAETVRAAAARHGARATLFRASEPVRAAVPPFPVEVAGVARIAERLKSAFDPAGVLNPGRLASAER